MQCDTPQPCPSPPRLSHACTPQGACCTNRSVGDMAAVVWALGLMRERDLATYSPASPLHHAGGGGIRGTSSQQHGEGAASELGKEGAVLEGPRTADDSMGSSGMEFLASVSSWWRQSVAPTPVSHGGDEELEVRVGLGWGKVWGAGKEGGQDMWGRLGGRASLGAGKMWRSGRGKLWEQTGCGMQRGQVCRAGKVDQVK